MKSCFLKGHGPPCSAKISREHYISATVLKALAGSNGTAQIGGLPWQPAQTLQSIGVQSLQSKILCETHNSGLGALDNVAGRLFRTLNAADKNPMSLPIVSQFDGPSVERWFIKVLCGLTAAAGFGDGMIPNQWKRILVGEDWPNLWGAYLAVPTSPLILAREFYLDTSVYSETGVILAATFRIAGVPFKIALGRPDNPEQFGVYRPQGIIFQLPAGERRVEFIWPFPNERTVVFSKVGLSTDRPPQWEGWKE